MFFFVIWHRTSLFCSSSKASQKAFLPDDVMFYSGQKTKHFPAQAFLCLSSNTMLLRKVIAFVGCCVNSPWERKLFSVEKKIYALSRVKHRVLVTLDVRCEVTKFVWVFKNKDLSVPRCECWNVKWAKEEIFTTEVILIKYDLSSIVLVSE